MPPFGFVTLGDALDVLAAFAMIAMIDSIIDQMHRTES